MSTFSDALNKLQSSGEKIYVEFSGGVYPATIALFIDDYVQLIVEYNNQNIKIHRHYTEVSLVGG
jgi:hypothetical protein